MITSLVGWFRKFGRGAPQIDPSQLPFKVGDRVQDIFGSKSIGTVVKIDLHAEHGLGCIRVKYDDGRVLDSIAIAHGLILYDQIG